MTLAKSEAKILQKKVNGKHYNDDGLIMILGTGSKSRINATLNQYKNKFETEIIKVLEHEGKNDFVTILQATIEYLVYPDDYFENILRESINKRGTDEGALRRVVATRAEVDMKIIKELYQKINSVLSNLLS